MDSKKMLKASLWYFIAAIVVGVFYRESTRMTNFVGKTTLAVVHSHLFSLGMLLFLILFALSLNDKFNQHKNSFGLFFKTYNIALPFMVIMMIIRGVVQVFGIEISKSQSAMISGISGLAHILVLVAFILLFRFLFKSFNSETQRG